MIEDDDVCALCHCVPAETFHHVIPKLLHRRKAFRQYPRDRLAEGLRLCRKCHVTVHRFISHRDLALTYNTVERLWTHDKLRSFLEWRQRRYRRAKPTSD